MKYRNDKKGFTLLELLVTITVLALITSIVYPVVTGVLRDAKEKAYQVQIANIEKASYDWIKLFPSSLPEDEGEKITIHLLDLKKVGLIDADVKDPITKKFLPDDMNIMITFTKNKYSVFVDDKSGTEKLDHTHKGILVLNGSAYIVEEINSKEAFVDPGVTGYDEDNISIDSSSIVTTVRKDGTVIPSVDMASLGTYELTYETSVNGKKIEVKRVVEVKDTTPPVISVPRNTSISTTTSSIDLMEGVSAEDNSGETVTVTASGNVTLHVPGVYVIRYAAEDSSGNKREKKRTITVS